MLCLAVRGLEAMCRFDPCARKQAQHASKATVSENAWFEKATNRATTGMERLPQIAPQLSFGSASTQSTWMAKCISSSAQRSDRSIRVAMARKLADSVRHPRTCGQWAMMQARPCSKSTPVIAANQGCEQLCWTGRIQNSPGPRMPGAS